MTARPSLVERLACLIFGHRWTVFYQEQCPVEYRQCSRCEWVRHYCDEIDWSKVAREQAKASQ